MQKEIRSMLRPRNAHAILNAMLGIPLGHIEFDPSGPMHEQSGIIMFNNIRYYALAQNRRAVKARLADQILRDMVLNIMRKIVTECFPNIDNPFKLDIDAEVIFSQDDFPLNYVVSYALHKLQELWAMDGFALPDFQPKVRAKKPNDSTPGPPSVPKRMRGIEDLPDIAPEMHPASLLSYMRPQNKYTALEHDKTAPWFSYELTVDDKTFLGEGPSKKQARRKAAALACSELFDVQFVELENN